MDREMDKDEKFNIFNGYNTHTILEICKRCTYVFIVQGAGHCPNTLSTTVHGQASRIITRQPPPPQIERAFLSTTCRTAEQVWCFKPWKSPPVRYPPFCFNLKHAFTNSEFTKIFVVSYKLNVEDSNLFYQSANFININIRNIFW